MVFNEQPPENIKSGKPLAKLAAFLTSGASR
jgi:hypothetical protein